jgi:hypothetical protein
MIEELRRKALELGATEFGESRAKNKRFYIIVSLDKSKTRGMRINFGLLDGHTYIDHHDDQKRRAWRARHSKILLKDGRPAYTVKGQPEYWSWHLLWP